MPGTRDQNKDQNQDQDKFTQNRLKSSIQSSDLEKKILEQHKIFVLTTLLVR